MYRKFTHKYDSFKIKRTCNKICFDLMWYLINNTPPSLLSRSLPWFFPFSFFFPPGQGLTAASGQRMRCVKRATDLPFKFRISSNGGLVIHHLHPTPESTSSGNQGASLFLGRTKIGWVWTTTLWYRNFKTRPLNTDPVMLSNQDFMNPDITMACDDSIPTSFGSFFIFGHQCWWETFMMESQWHQEIPWRQATLMNLLAVRFEHVRCVFISSFCLNLIVLQPNFSQKWAYTPGFRFCPLFVVDGSYFPSFWPDSRLHNMLTQQVSKKNILGGSSQLVSG